MLIMLLTILVFIIIFGFIMYKVIKLSDDPNSGFYEMKDEAYTKEIDPNVENKGLKSNRLLLVAIIASMGF